MRAHGDHGDVDASGRQRDGGHGLHNTSVTITYEDGTTATCGQCDGTFDVRSSRRTTSASRRDNRRCGVRSDETFTLSGQTATQASAVTGTATITDDGSNGGTDDRPTVSTISSSEWPKARQRRST
ncbi:hypothetical protein HPK20_15680 [Vibrio fluvialis]|nr:hypothetical protein [Vibrio fluvialis]QKE35939.1 hypothetical protein HPK20_15680 [Vibrio fluvialis]